LKDRFQNLKISSEEKIRIVIDGLRGELSIAELCKRKSNHLFPFGAYSQ